MIEILSRAISVFNIEAHHRKFSYFLYQLNWGVTGSCTAFRTHINKAGR